VATTFQWDTTRPLIMGVLNVTPDSFSDGGRFADVDRAVEHAREMARAGAGIIDIGGESTRPGAAPVSAEEELRRVMPVIERLAAAPHPDPLPAPRGEGIRSTREAMCVSIDTTKAVVAEKALGAGARIVNDISALRFDARMVEVVRDAGAGLVLMHMQGTPQTMQQAPHYDDVVAEVRTFLAERVAFAEAHGVKKSQIAVDPGIGFGKTVEQNLQLLARLEELTLLGCPVLVGPSRKSFIGRVLAAPDGGQMRPADGRLWGTAATVAWAVAQGARIVRVHDVAEMADVVRMMEAIRRTRSNGLEGHAPSWRR
jgi:dihydropteroate synthase